ncbi:uncharacterized protein LOC129725028 [Wyeomyia smithii]|uniref:uncharacterized protein LOC129725028 n=1 Tax=Wyeomyia smithii TaxID=174621 RepID=UPI0024681AB3|nr:uncharacterized protein LOC129725028 [Wyeomyia smithii]
MSTEKKLGSNDSVVAVVADLEMKRKSNKDSALISDGGTRSSALVLDSNYIENKIKNLLNQKDAVKTAIDDDAEDENSDSEQNGNRMMGILTTEDSCNAVDNKLFSRNFDDNKHEVSFKELSFNGKIKSFNAQSSMNSGSEKLAIAGSALTCSEKSNQDKLNESFEILTKENSSLMHYNNEKSPDLFADDDYDDTSEDEKSKSDLEVHDCPKELNSKQTIPDNDGVSNIERILLKRMQLSLSGVPPPPAVTFSQVDINRVLDLYKENESCSGFSNDQTIERASPGKLCLSKPTHSPTELFSLSWPEILKCRAHGLHYNRSNVSENIELLGLKYVDRYIGAETSSTFNVIHSPSSTKKRNLRLKMLNQSPGSRLSHLARRRAVFSSANLLNSSVNSVIATGLSNTFRASNRQILLDAKKSDNRRKNKGRTPKRRTPGRRKTPSRRKTPGSSSKKRALSLPMVKQSQPVSRESSKRALFQSPPREGSNNLTAIPATSVAGSSSTVNKVQKSKRALFSPPKRVHRFSSVSSSRSNLSVKESLMSSQRYGSTNNIEMLKEHSGVTDIITGESVDLGGKRKRSEDHDDDIDLSTNIGKIARVETIKEEDLTPRSLKLARSQSFCSSLKNSNCSSASENSLCGKSLFRASSEVTFPNSGNRSVAVLTENHKKKLLWAVSQALQTKQITVKHNNFKEYASNLARVVKRLFLEFNDNTVTSTSEKLLRFANRHVFEVIQGHSVDDIYLKEKTRIMNARNFGKIQGYIAPEDYEHRKQMLKRSTSTSVLIADNSSDASLSACSSQLQLSQRSFLSQSSEFLNQLSQTSHHSSQVTDLNGSQNTILRENIDSEQRQKSAQKQVSFSGKDQKNLSPYADKCGSLAKSVKLIVGGALSSTSVLKAKRQISFE